jgi:hypothetical protein
MGIPTSVFAWSSERSPAREHLRNVLIHDQADRDAIASKLLRYRVERGDDWPNEDR